MAASGEPAPPGRVPDFFIVGHSKGATTALYHMLRSHPRIFMPDIKEPRFFAPELRSRFRALGPGTLPETLDGYLQLFGPARPDQLAGEASPTYLRSRTAARRIAELAARARIIAILREPAAFLRSFHLQAVHNHSETETDFAKAIALEDERRQGHRIPRFSQSPAALLYSDHVRYTEQLRRYHEAFGRDRVLVLIYEEFRADNVATVREVLRFLDVDDTNDVQPVITSPLRAVRSVGLLQLKIGLGVARRRAARSGPVVKALERRVPKPMGNASFRRMWDGIVYTDPPPPDEDFMRQLRRRFAGEVASLSEYLGRDLASLWGYDRLS